VANRRLCDEGPIAGDDGPRGRGDDPGDATGQEIGIRERDLGNEAGEGDGSETRGTLLALGPLLTAGVAAPN